jgi:hypothetical protein
MTARPFSAVQVLYRPAKPVAIPVVLLVADHSGTTGCVVGPPALQCCPLLTNLVLGRTAGRLQTSYTRVPASLARCVAECGCQLRRNLLRWHLLCSPCEPAWLGRCGR